MNLKINLPELFWSYSLSLFPLFILVGPLISELYIFAIIIFTHIYIINEKKIYFLNNKYIIFFILFYISTIFSTLLNFYSFDYSKSAIFFFRFIFFSIAIWYVLKTYNVFSKKTVSLYSLLLLTIIIDALIQYYSGKNILGYEILRNRISSFFGDELVLGSFITRFIPIFLVYLLMTDNITENKINIFYSLIISFSSVIVYLSGERTSFFLLILFFLTLFILSKYLRKLIVFIMISSIVFSLIITKLQTNEQLNGSNRMFQKTYQQIIGHGSNTIESKKKLFNKIYIFSHDHHGHYLLSYKIFKDYPVFGTGVKGFRYLCRSKIYILENNEGCSTHPHNTYIQILASNGIVGFFLIIFAFFYILREIFLCKKKLNSQIIFDKNELSKGVILLLIFINLWPLVPTGNFFNNWISIIYFYPIGFYLYFKHLNEKKIN
jgi:O-antigen ligase